MGTGLKIKYQNVVMLPGLDGTGMLFEPFLRAMPSDCRPFVVSYPSDQPQNYQQLIPRIREVAPWDEPYLLVAESFAGPLALLFAQVQHENLQGIVLSASFVRNPLPAFFSWVQALTGTALFRKTPPPALLKKYLLDPSSPGPLVDSVNGIMRAVTPSVLAYRLEMITKTDVSEALRDCPVPLLCLLPSRDQLMERRGWESIAAVRTDLATVEIEGPHLLLQSKPKQCWTAIDLFLKRLQAPSQQAA